MIMLIPISNWFGILPKMICLYLKLKFRPFFRICSRNKKQIQI